MATYIQLSEPLNNSVDTTSQSAASRGCTAVKYMLVYFVGQLALLSSAFIAGGLPLAVLIIGFAITTAPAIYATGCLLLAIREDRFAATKYLNACIGICAAILLLSCLLKKMAGL